MTKNQAVLFFAAVFFGWLVFAPLQIVQANEITAKSVVDFVNKDRLTNGLDVLEENSLLYRAAQEKVSDMINNDYFAHTSPKGISPWYWIEKGGYDYKYAGENLAINFTSAESQHEAWMASATHRKNILNPNYKEIGVAIAKGKINGQAPIITVQLFGTRTGVFSRGPENSQTQKEAKVIQGERTTGIESEKNINPEPVSFIPLSPQLKLSDIQPDKINIEQSEDNREEVAWVVVIAVLILSIMFNAAMLSRRENNNPFIAVNTIVLIMVLTSVVLWKI